MFSKEWKLVVLSVLTVTLATACGRDKKKHDDSTPYAGLWVNAQAYDALSAAGMSGDPRLCQMVQERLCDIGLTPTPYGDLAIDAWQVEGNGDVYRYAPFTRSQAVNRDLYLRGRIAGSEFFPKNNRGGFHRGNGGACVTPFESGSAITNLEAGQLRAWAPGRPWVGYVRVTAAQLNAMNASISICTVQVGGGYRGHGQGVVIHGQGPMPLPQQGPAIDPQYDGWDKAQPGMPQQPQQPPLRQGDK